MKAIQYLEKAIELDSSYGRAHAALASTYLEISHRLWHDVLGMDHPEHSHLRAERSLKTAMEHPTPLAHQVASKISIGDRLFERALSEAERSIALDPNDPNSYLAMANALIYIGRPAEAIDFVKKAMRLDPQYPAYYLFFLGMAQFGMDQYEEAADSLERALERNPENFIALIPLAAAYGYLERRQEAETAVKELIETEPFMTLFLLKSWTPFGNYKDPNDKKRLVDGLEKAGLPLL